MDDVGLTWSHHGTASVWSHHGLTVKAKNEHQGFVRVLIHTELLRPAVRTHL